MGVLPQYLLNDLLTYSLNLLCSQINIGPVLKFSNVALLGHLSLPQAMTSGSSRSRCLLRVIVGLLDSNQGHVLQYSPDHMTNPSPFLLLDDARDGLLVGSSTGLH